MIGRGAASWRPMILLRKPTAKTIQNFLARQSGLAFTYQSVGATATGPPTGYMVDHTRIKLGQGEAVFAAAKAAMKQWRQMDLGWVHAWSPGQSIVKGALVGVAGRFVGLWWLNACQIVYVTQEKGAVERFGVAYGSLPGHIALGEERFLVEWTRADDNVWFDILAFSRPRQLLARLGYPLLRRLQKRFGRESAAAMLRIAQNASTASRIDSQSLPT